MMMFRPHYTFHSQNAIFLVTFNVLIKNNRSTILLQIHESWMNTIDADLILKPNISEHKNRFYCYLLKIIIEIKKQLNLFVDIKTKETNPTTYYYRLIHTTKVNNLNGFNGFFFLFRIVHINTSTKAPPHSVKIFAPRCELHKCEEAKKNCFFFSFNS